MARTPGLDGLIARNRKAAEVMDASATAEGSPAAVTNPPDQLAGKAASQQGSQLAGQPAGQPADVRSDAQTGAVFSSNSPHEPASQPANRLTGQVDGGLTGGGYNSGRTTSEPPSRRTEALSAAADRKQLNTYVRKTIIRDARRKAEDDGTTISDVVDRLLEGWLAGRLRL